MKERIVIVDDEPAIVDAIQYALETEGFETLCFSTGMSAVEALAAQQVDLVILDIGLPDIGGFDLCRLIRQQSSVPIIFLTARSGEIDRIVGLELGADDYVTKPFSPREVSARVKAVLRRTTGTTGATGTTGTTGDVGNAEHAASSPGAFSVNESKRQICYYGSMVDLSRYEYDILKTFIRRPGHVYSREQLMQLVWEHPECSLDRTIDAHIKNIRAKLKKMQPEIEAIVTHRGTGYALRDDL
ncbi:two-component system response regulator CreB [Geomonas sp. Red32]|uniref:two-component system response regulator CreB n=1 Tax=Geomonas sp. Red32 TaxID=2912856 RepID=UPI00202CAF80|nr:two-component system response regulator CreB [Geomonas sp. Red32]MCM0083834.1 two-component system response regulator CreB [Geomonas sp. Red32]